MTALTVPARQDASPRPVPWRRMAWVTWRQHRIALARAAVRVDRVPPPPRGLMHPRHAGPLRFDGE